MYIHAFCYIKTAGEGESALSVSAFYCWLDWVKYLVEAVGLNPKGENGTSRKTMQLYYFESNTIVE